MKIKLFFAMLVTLPMYANIDSVAAAQNIGEKGSLNDKNALSVVLKYLAYENAKIQEIGWQRESNQPKRNIANFAKVAKITRSAVESSHFNHYPLRTKRDLKNYPDLEKIVLYDFEAKDLKIAKCAVKEKKITRISVTKRLLYPSSEFVRIKKWATHLKAELVFEKCCMYGDYCPLKKKKKSLLENDVIPEEITEIIKIARPLIYPIFQDFTLILPDSVKIIRSGAFRDITPTDDVYSLKRKYGCLSVKIPGTVKSIGGLISFEGIAPGQTLTLNFKDEHIKSTELEVLLSYLLGTQNCGILKKAPIPEGVYEITKEFGESISYIKDLYLPSTLVKLDPEALVLPYSIGYMTIHAPKNLPENVLVVLKQLKGYRVVFDL